MGDCPDVNDCQGDKELVNRTRQGGFGLGLFAILSPRIATGTIFAAGSPGAEIHPAIAALSSDVVIK